MVLGEARCTARNGSFRPKADVLSLAKCKMPRSAGLRGYFPAQTICHQSMAFLGSHVRSLGTGHIKYLGDTGLLVCVYVDKDIFPQL